MTVLSLNETKKNSSMIAINHVLFVLFFIPLNRFLPKPLKENFPWQSTVLEVQLVGNNDSSSVTHLSYIKITPCLLVVKMKGGSDFGDTGHQSAPLQVPLNGKHVFFQGLLSFSASQFLLISCLHVREPGHRHSHTFWKHLQGCHGCNVE